jgi:hypothetical protein
MVAADRAIVEDEIEQVWHLLQISRDVRIVSSQVNIVEHDINNALDFAAG